MKERYEFRYDRQANAIYIRLRPGASARQREYSSEIILDFDTQSALIGVEVLDPEADLSTLVQEFGLDPHILVVLRKLLELIPEAQQQLVLV